MLLPAEIYQIRKRPDWHWAMLLFMNNDYNNLVLSTNEEEEYCAEMISNSELPFRDVLFGGYDLSYTAEDVIQLWLEIIQQEYGTEQLVFPQDPTQANNFLAQIGDYIGMDLHLEAVANGVPPLDIP